MPHIGPSWEETAGIPPTQGGCGRSARAGHDGDMRHHDLVIIGTGSGNGIADERFAHLDIAIIEEGTFGGTCLNVGCIPTKMFVHTADLAQGTAKSSRFGVDAHVDKVRWPDIRDRIFGRIDPIASAGELFRRASDNITVYSEHATFTGHKRLTVTSGQEMTADRIVIAAGSRPTIPDSPVSATCPCTRATRSCASTTSPPASPSWVAAWSLPRWRTSSQHSAHR